MEFGAIYGQALDQSGNKLWGTEVRVDSDTELQQQSSPTVAANQDGSILVAWQRRPLQRDRVRSEAGLKWPKALGNRNMPRGQ